jgi:glutaredoxin
MADEKLFKYGFFALLIVLVAFGAYYFGNVNAKVSEQTYEGEDSIYNSEQNAQILKFSECIADKGFEAFTADWCPHCENLKEYFGGDKNVEPFWIVCQDANRGLTKDSQRCSEEGIRGFPTLKLNGQELQIARTFDSISLATGCPAPNI